MKRLPPVHFQYIHFREIRSAYAGMAARVLNNRGLIIFLSFLLILVFTTCRKDQPEVPDLSTRITISTDIPIAKSYGVATVSGNLGKTYGETVVDYGHCWDTTHNPEITAHKKSYGAQDEKTAFTSQMSDLAPGKAYYVRAYFIIFDTEVYSEETTFITRERSIPDLLTDTVYLTDPKSVNAVGTVTGINDDSIIEKGFCWSLSPEPLIEDNKLINISSEENFENLISGLLLDTLYYFRAYAINSIGVGYGEIKTFRTPDGLPKVTTSPVSTIEASIATGGGTVSDDGGFRVIERGVCWSLSPNPLISDDKTLDGQGTGSFKSEITGLNKDTNYFLRAYAKNSQGVVYGNEISFTTQDGIILITTDNFSKVTGYSAQSGGNIISDGGYSVTARGICWSAFPNPSVSDNKTSDGIGTGEYISQLTDLEIHTRYHVRAYAINQSGIYYGEEKYFTTTEGLITVQTGNITDIMSTSASISGTVVSDGGVDVSQRGICWSTSPNPTTNNHVSQEGTGTGSFTSALTDLSPQTTIYVRAYAINNTGTYYGEVKSFTTKDGIIYLTTLSTTELTAVSARSGGYITEDGGERITGKGICWNTQPQPTINNFMRSAGTGSDNFTAELTDLNHNTTYYLRAYATNKLGTFYGNEIILTTRNGIPVITTLDADNITANSAVSGGEISDDGGAQIIRRGICWSVTLHPTIDNYKTEEGEGPGYFSVTLENLINNTNYYIRAYAENIAGIHYGNEIQMKTQEGSISINTKSISSITLNSALSGGVISDDGGSMVSEKGVCWSTSPAPLTENSKTSDGEGSSEYSSLVENLEPNTTYYLRAYAVNNTGTSYGNERIFKTHSGIIGLATHEVQNITASSATFGGTISDNGGIPVLSRGICWNTSPEPDISDQIQLSGEGLGEFTINPENLDPNTVYYVRSFASNAVSTYYGNEISFSTRDGIIRLETKRVTDIGNTTAKSGGEIIDNGGTPVLAKGVCWSTSPSPDINDFTSQNGTGSSPYTSTLSNLIPENEYYVRAWASNVYGTFYGQEIVFANKTSGSIIDTRDGKTYHWLKIGDQFWLTENMAWLPEVHPPSEGSSSTANYYVYDYNGSIVSEAKSNSNYEKYGVLYNYKSALEACPDGWHVPEDDDWEELAVFISDDQGGYLKSGDDWLDVGKHLKSSAGWVTGNGIDDYNFSGSPGGARNSEGYFFDARINGYWWSSTETGNAYSIYRYLQYSDSDFHRNETIKELGISVRCIRDH